MCNFILVTVSFMLLWRASISANCCAMTENEILGLRGELSCEQVVPVSSCTDCKDPGRCRVDAFCLCPEDFLDEGSDFYRGLCEVAFQVPWPQSIGRRDLQCTEPFPSPSASPLLQSEKNDASQRLSQGTIGGAEDLIELMLRGGHGEHSSPDVPAPDPPPPSDPTKTYPPNTTPPPTTTYPPTTTPPPTTTSPPTTTNPSTSRPTQPSPTPPPQTNAPPSPSPSPSPKTEVQEDSTQQNVGNENEDEPDGNDGGGLNTWEIIGILAGVVSAAAAVAAVGVAMYRRRRVRSDPFADYD